MLLDVSPLRRHRDYRFLFAGQLVSSFGTHLTYVALPVQVYQLTKSSAIVGLVGIAQLIPLAVTALWGGAVADAIDRRRLIVITEALLLLGSLALVLNAVAPRPSVVLVIVIAAFMAAVNGFHTPALQSLTPRLVDADEMAAVSALGSFRGSLAAIVGPALAGLCIAAVGVSATYAIDAVTFLVSLGAVSMIRSIPPSNDAPAVGVSSIVQGVRYALGRPVLVGTYIVDIVAMTFAMPMALFPAMGETWGGAAATGYLISAMSAGAFAMTLVSGWAKHVRRQGAAVMIAAGLWGVAIVALGYARSLPVALACLAAAGAADMVSALFRMTIWNETIPDELRGRLAGIEQLSYMSGPLLGNARAGLMAERYGLQASIVWGGVLCVLGVAACRPTLPAFWRFSRGDDESRRTPPA